MNLFQKIRKQFGVFVKVFGVFPYKFRKRFGVQHFKNGAEFVADFNNVIRYGCGNTENKGAASKVALLQNKRQTVIILEHFYHSIRIYAVNYTFRALRDPFAAVK